MKRKSSHFDIEIDELTNSIENVISGEIFQTDCVPLKILPKRIFKKKDWNFDWSLEIKKLSREVYKLITVSNPEIIHGLISISNEGDHIFMHLIESASFNRGSKKLYRGIAGKIGRAHV